MSDVVTGDAVVVDVQIAQLPIRAGARLIDAAIQAVLLLGAVLLVSQLWGSLGLDDSILQAVIILFLVLLLVGYPLIFESLTRGRTPGKMALGLRVVSDDGGPQRFRQAMFRALSGTVEIYALSAAPAVICSLAHPRGKRLGDVFAGTMVISERGPRRDGPAPEMPPPLAGWAAGLELSQLTEEAAAMARQYLARWHQLNAVAQFEMGRRIAAQVAAVVSPPPPPGVPPHAYLAAVLAERRRRESVRLEHAKQGTTPQPAGYQAPHQAPYQPPYAAPGQAPYQVPDPSPFAPPYAEPAQAASPTYPGFPGYRPTPPSGPPVPLPPPNESTPGPTPGGFAPPV
ncbi:membrane protein [Acrocarpospora phusangensis]|uniref:Membrane protein n=1 Tax=Acrocarpospora phusangensis TaxID=1070424 RepID=A0A919Q7H9_9ACTN|nr:RDD family protein [Acrocarpospora phusangensis]GIH22080.1 membrane protein [Acrocarpospora phusangensis]